MRPTEILLVEDNPGDVMLLLDAFQQTGWEHHLNLVLDGAEALDFLFRRGIHASAPRPDLILLDLNLPIKNGREVLVETRLDPQVAGIPTIILSGSEWERGILQAFGLPDSCYFVKPMTFHGYLEVAREMEALMGKLVETKG